MSCSEAFLPVPSVHRNVLKISPKLTEIQGIAIVKFSGAEVKHNKWYLFLLRKMKSVGSRKTQF